MENIILYDCGEIICGKVLHRPSKKIKSPYVADIMLSSFSSTILEEEKEKVASVSEKNEEIEKNEETEVNEFLAHCPSLGCCGLVDKEAQVYLTKNKNPNVKTAYTVDLAILEEIKNGKKYREIIGLHPKIAEKIGYNAIEQNCIPSLQNVKLLQKEKKFENSRFDIYGIDEHDQEFILEIKTVPLADYVDCAKKDRKNYTELIESKEWNQKIAYFPDGYRKNKNDPVSPRALKHIQELEKISLEGKYKCYLLFIIQRTDVEYFQTSVIDSIYKEAVVSAANNGVGILTLQVNWNKEDGKAYFYSNNLPIKL